MYQPGTTTYQQPGTTMYQQPGTTYSPDTTIMPEGTTPEVMPDAPTTPDVTPDVTPDAVLPKKEKI